MRPNQATHTSIKYLLLLVRYARAAARAAIQYMLALSEETFLVSKIASALDMKVRLIGFFFISGWKTYCTGCLKVFLCAEYCRQSNSLNGFIVANLTIVPSREIVHT